MIEPLLCWLCREWYYGPWIDNRCGTCNRALACYACSKILFRQPTVRYYISNSHATLCRLFWPDSGRSFLCLLALAMGG